MTLLAAFLVAVIAMQPFAIGHLFRQLADDLPTGTASFGIQRMTRGAQLCIADMQIVGWTKATRGGLHDVLVTLHNLEGAVLWMPFLEVRGVNDESAIETRPRSELLFSNLVAHGAIHAIFGLKVLFLILVKRQMRKDFA